MMHQSVSTFMQESCGRYQNSKHGCIERLTSIWWHPSHIRSGGETLCTKTVGRTSFIIHSLGFGSILSRSSVCREADHSDFSSRVTSE